MDGFTRLMLRAVALPTAVTGVVVALVASFVADTSGFAGALIGTAVVLVFFLVGQTILAHVLRTNPMMGMTVALLLYLVKIGVLLALLVLLQGTTAFNTKSFAVAILACTLVWTGCEVVVFARTKVLVADPDNVPPAVQQLAELDKDRRARG